jgi:uncharacterized delta-60 repeat protein
MYMKHLAFYTVIFLAVMGFVGCSSEKPVVDFTPSLSETVLRKQQGSSATVTLSIDWKDEKESYRMVNAIILDVPDGMFIDIDGYREVSIKKDGKVSIDIPLDVPAGQYDIKFELFTFDDDHRQIIHNLNLTLDVVPLDISLDHTFGVDGKIVLGTRLKPHYYQGFVLDSHGRSLIVTSSSTSSCGPSDGATKPRLSRYDLNGNLDTSFGDNGSSEFAGCLALIDSQNRILSIYGNTVRRYLPDGSLDKSFGERKDGVAILYDTLTYFNNEPMTTGLFQITDVGVDSQNRIVLGGIHDNKELFIVRLKDDGTWDAAFDEDGKVFRNIATSGVEVELMNDSIVIAGTFPNSRTDSYDVYLTRHSSDGSLDATFGSNGTTVIGTGNKKDEDVADLLIDDNQRILLSVRNKESYGGGLVTRYLPSGLLDETFGTKGEIAFDFFSFGAEIMSDDKGGFIVYGISNSSRATIYRYLRDWTLDTSFDMDGEIVSSFEAYYGVTCATDSEGKLVVASSMEMNASVIARYISQ